MLRKGHILAILVIGISFVIVPVFAQNNEVLRGALGSEHVHASISVILHGDTFDFSGPAYQIKSSLIHFEGGDGTTIHRHATGVATGFLFYTIGIGLDDECYNFQTLSGVRWFCTDDDYTLKFYINRKPVPNIRDYIFEDGDKILITYGAERLTPTVSLLANLDAQPIVDEPAGMGFYENELYDFSYNIPMDWRYIENYALPDDTSLQVVQYPQEFAEGFSVYNSPNISISFENIAESQIPILNKDAIERYELEKLRIDLPNGKISNYEIKSTPYGWESSFEVFVSLNIPFVVRGDFHTHDKTFYFKDSRESYTVGYISPVEYYDYYHSVFEDVIDTMVIKGVVVPEFQEIAMMVLASSIVLVIVFARKFSKFTLSENS